MRFSMISMAALALVSATPAFAQDTDAPEVFTVSGGATVVSDYRFRGFSQTNEEATIQGTFSITHESGAYIGVWGSGIGFANGTEIDAFAGYSREVTSGLTADAGVTFYLYPGAGGSSTIIEPYFSLSGDLGPVSAKAGVAYAPSGQTALADESAVYLYTDLGFGIPNTPLSVSGHIGYANSDSFLGGLDGEVIDYSVGISASQGALTLGVAYVGTDSPSTAYAGPPPGTNFREDFGADGTIVFSLGASF